MGHSSRRTQTATGPYYPSLLPNAVIKKKKMRPKQLGEERVSLPYRQRCSTGGGQGRKGSRGHGEMVLTGLFYTACSFHFLIQHRTTCPGVVPQTVGWSLPYQSLIRRNAPTDLSTVQSDGDNSSANISSS